MKDLIDLSTFKKVQEGMIAKNASSWDEYYSQRINKVRDYTPEEIEEIINSGSLSEQQRLSRNYYDKDGLYKRIILHYATLLNYYGILIPNPAFGKQLSTSHIQKRYFGAMNFVDRFINPELFTEITIKALIDGCYYGILQDLTKDSFVLISLPSGYCRSRFRDIMGNDIIEFDVSYFYTITDSRIRDDVLNTYPAIVKEKFNQYDAGKLISSWVRIPSEIGICFPFFDDGRPMFLNVIPATIQYDEAVETEQEREKEEIRKIIVQKIPHLNDGQLLFEPVEAESMHSGAVGMMKGNKNISVLTTYADVDAIISRTSAEKSNDSLSKMLQNVFSEAGTSGELFAPTGSQALGTSITNDIALMMILGNKYSRFVSYILNELYGNSNIYFKYSILPISYYNQKDYISDTLKLAQSGYSFLLPAIASGLNQQSLINVKSLENDVLKLRDILIPLSSSYTQSSNSEDSNSEEKTTKTDADENKGGAPEKELEEKAEKTIKNEESIERQGGSTNANK